MKPVIYGVVLLTILCTGIANRHAPRTGLNLWTLRKVPDAELAVMREDTIRLVRGGVVQGERHPGERYFEVSCDGKPVMLMGNSLGQLVMAICG